MYHVRNIFRFISLVGVFAFLLASCVACATALQRVPAPRTELSEVQRKAAVELHMMCFDKDRGVLMWRGSGTIIGEYKVLTADHVTSCPSGISYLTVTHLGGAEQVATVVVSLPKYDISTVTVDMALPYVPVQIGKAPKRGDVVCTESAIPVRSRACGKVTRVAQDKGYDLTHNGVTVPGNSGSGVYDSRGMLVGVATRTLMRGGKYVRGMASTVWQHKDRL